MWWSGAWIRGCRTECGTGSQPVRRPEGGRFAATDGLRTRSTLERSSRFEVRTKNEERVSSRELIAISEPYNLRMGLTCIAGEVSGSTGKSVSVRFLVDSGATYSLLAETDWKTIGLQPKRSATFTLADGTRLERAISECRVVLPQGECHSPVILGEATDQPLLGMVTLEILGLVLNPFSRELQPMKMMLA